jgi:hypothetical protein
MYQNIPIQSPDVYFMLVPQLLKKIYSGNTMDEGYNY